MDEAPIKFPSKVLETWYVGLQRLHADEAPVKIEAIDSTCEVLEGWSSACVLRAAARGPRSRIGSNGKGCIAPVWYAFWHHGNWMSGRNRLRCARVVHKAFPAYITVCVQAS